MRDQCPIVRGIHMCELGHKLPGCKPSIADGVYAGWSWDGQRLSAYTDRYGLFPLFYYVDSHQITLSPSLITLVLELKLGDLDAEALAVFFHLGFFVDEDTPFLGVKVLPASGRLSWAGTLLLEGGQTVGGRLQCSRDDAIDEFNRLFAKAIERRLGFGEFVVPISGGQDSRQILLELDRQGMHPHHCVTASAIPPKLTDVAPAQELCRAVGVSHLVTPRAAPFDAEQQKNLLTHFCTDEHAWFMGVANHLAETPHPIFDGIGGGIAKLQKPKTLQLYREGRWQELAQYLAPRSTDLLAPVLPEGYLSPHAQELAHQRIIRTLRRYENATNPMTMFFFWNRTRREIALQSFGILRGVTQCLCPYLDHEVFDFAISLPPDIQNNFHHDAIQRAYPKYADIPYSGVLKRDKRLFGFSGFGFAMQVMRYAVRNNVQWVSRILPICSSSLKCTMSRRYRSAHFWLSPPRWLYVAQLEKLRARQEVDPIRLRRHCIP